MIDWQRIENFVGFGRIDAPVVFIGMEEGLASPEELDGDLAIRSKYATPIMDLKEAHRGVAGTERYFDPESAPRQPTWRVMADLMLRRDGVSHPSGDDRRAYRALRLGRSGGETLLTELLPYPHPRTSDWLYGRITKYATREAYVAEMLPRRLRLLSEVLSAAPREIVVCYGKANWAHYEMLFKTLQWKEDSNFRVSVGHGPKVVFCKHFSARDFNSNEQLQRFAEIVGGKSAFEASSGSSPATRT